MKNIADKNYSSLLINEYPLMVLPQLAKLIGLNEAIILQQIHYWLLSSKHTHDGRKWIYNSYPSWKEQFPFWSEKTIWTTIKNLEGKLTDDKKGKNKKKRVYLKRPLLLSGNFNTLKIDKTKWYTIDYDAVVELLAESEAISQKLRDGNEIFARPIPETNTETTVSVYLVDKQNSLTPTVRSLVESSPKQGINPSLNEKDKGGRKERDWDWYKDEFLTKSDLLDLFGRMPRLGTHSEKRVELEFKNMIRYRLGEGKEVKDHKQLIYAFETWVKNKNCTLFSKSIS